MCRCEKRRHGTGICSGCSFTFLWIFPSWQPMQERAAAAMSRPIFGQQNEDLTSLVVALNPLMMNLVKTADHRLAKNRRYKRAKRPRRYVAEEVCIACWPPDNLERG
jgi:hypothetical protein